MTRGDRSIWRARSSGIPTPVSSSSLSAPHAYSGTDLLLVESASEIMGLPEARRARGLATYVLRKQGAVAVALQAEAWSRSPRDSTRGRTA